MNENWTELKIKVPAPQADIAGAIANMVVPYGIYMEDYSHLEEEALEIAHIDLIDEELLQKDREHAIIHIYISPEANPAQAVSFLEERFQAEGIPYEIDRDSCVEEDWINNWKKYFKPIPVGERLLVRPIWEDEYDAGGRAVLHLEPGLAFGTGTHETTSLCLEVLDEMVQGGERMLDIGTGSGILAIAALKLGAASAEGVDIDPMCVRTAGENAARNGVEDRLTVLVGDLSDKATGVYDIITANIVASAILSLAPHIPALLAPGGLFVSSGIIDTRKEEVLAGLREAGLDPFEVREKRGWVCILCHKKEA